VGNIAIDHHGDALFWEAAPIAACRRSPDGGRAGAAPPWRPEHRGGRRRRLFCFAMQTASLSCARPCGRKQSVPIDVDASGPQARKDARYHLRVVHLFPRAVNGRKLREASVLWITLLQYIVKVRPGPISMNIAPAFCLSAETPDQNLTGSRRCRAQNVGSVASCGLIQVPVTLDS
jgi:hypothetical protein